MKKRKAKAVKKSEPKILEYKIVELSAVDEVALESTVNEWINKGYAFDGVQFAMRESSRRPSMAFVFFTRESDTPMSAVRSQSEAQSHLKRLSAGLESVLASSAHEAAGGTRKTGTKQSTSQSLSAWERLEKMAQGDE